LNVLTSKNLDIEIEEQGGRVKECFFPNLLQKRVDPRISPYSLPLEKCGTVRKINKKRTVMQFNPGCCDTRKSKLVDTSAPCINVLITGMIYQRDKSKSWNKVTGTLLLLRQSSTRPNSEKC